MTDDHDILRARAVAEMDQISAELDACFHEQISAELLTQALRSAAGPDGCGTKDAAMAALRAVREKVNAERRACAADGCVRCAIWIRQRGGARVLRTWRQLLLFTFNIARFWIGHALLRLGVKLSGGRPMRMEARCETR